jgi:hypothetical protein
VWAAVSAPGCHTAEKLRVRDCVVGSHCDPGLSRSRIISFVVRSPCKPTSGSESFSEYRSMGPVHGRGAAFLCCGCNTSML